MNISIPPLVHQLLAIPNPAPASPMNLDAMDACAMPRRALAANDAGFRPPAGPGLRGAYAAARPFPARFQVR